MKSAFLVTLLVLFMMVAASMHNNQPKMNSKTKSMTSTPFVKQNEPTNNNNNNNNNNNVEKKVTFGHVQHIYYSPHNLLQDQFISLANLLKHLDEYAFWPDIKHDECRDVGVNGKGPAHRYICDKYAFFVLDVHDPVELIQAMEKHLTSDAVDVPNSNGIEYRVGFGCKKDKLGVLDSKEPCSTVWITV